MWLELMGELPQKRTKGKKVKRDGTKLHTAPKKSNGFDARELDDHSKLIVQVRKIMRERDVARAANEFSKSDTYRDQLSSMGVLVKDQVGGPSGWKFKDGRTKKLKAGTKVP